MTNKETLEEFIIKSRLVHGDKYDYSNSIHNGKNKKLEIICLKHGLFWQTPNNHHVHKHGCPYCAGQRVNSTNCLSTTHPQIVKMWHPTKNNELTPENCTRGSRKRAWFVCEQGHEWDATISCITHDNSGCPKCSPTKRSTNESFVERSITVHGHRYDYSKVNYINNKTKVIIICLKHGEFKQIPNSHLSGSGCPSCKNSRGVNEVVRFLNDLNVKYIQEHKIEKCKNKRPFPFDLAIFDENENLLGLIEYYGIQHYEPINYFGGNEKFEKLKKRDEIKFNFCRDNSIPLLIISYVEHKNIESITNNFLNEINSYLIMK